MTATVILAAEGIEKRFGATQALAGVDFSVPAGEVHALVGENGAGKSTLIRILGGIHRPDRGRILLDGVPRSFAGPREAIAAGIVTIPQELRVVPALDAAENIVLGDWPTRGWTVDRRRMAEEARAALAMLDVALPLDIPVRRLGYAERQLVAIAKALRRRARVLILDEPTAALERREVARLFDVLARLRARGSAIVYISHRLQEIIDIADRCTVLRDGVVVAESLRGAFDIAGLVRAMVGGGGDEAVAQGGGSFGPALLEDEALAVRSGEVVGLAGLLGSGARQRIRRLFSGRSQPRLGARTVTVANPRRAIAAGIGMVAGERALGLVMSQTVRENILLPSLDRAGRPWWIAPAAGEPMVRHVMNLLDIRPRDPDIRVSALSGGNQQKVIFAKWLAREVAVLLLDEPTQGIDIAAKAQIHRVIRDFAARGGGAVVSSSDIDEMIRLCDTMLAVREGRIAARLEGREAMSEQAVREAIGG